MGLRFRKSFKVAPGVRVNVGKNSVGASIGGKNGGVSVNSKTGASARVSAPGTGFSYYDKIGGGNNSQDTPHASKSGAQSFQGTELFLDAKTLSSLNQEAFLSYSQRVIESAEHSSPENYDKYSNELRLIREESARRESIISCNSQKGRKTSNVLMWILLIFIPPIGIAYMWASKKEFSLKKKIVLSIIFVIWFLIAILL